MIPLTEDRKMLGYGVFTPYPNIFCFTTTRHGGCSTGNYGSFNCTPYTGDDTDCVRKNQETLCNAMPLYPQELIIPFQTHGSNSLIIDKTYREATFDERHSMLQGIDALITDVPRHCICISTADCIPILLYDKQHNVVAAVHAGWRGTVNRILAKTLLRMQAVYGTEGKDIIACIGPGISLASFEVGDEVCETFRAESFPMEYISVWKPETHKYHIDLWAANRLQLSDFGIPSRQIESAGICTYHQHEEFFSARRLGIKSGRILSGIMLKNKDSELLSSLRQTRN